MIDKLVFALTYYNCPLMLREQIKYWQEYPDHLVDQMKVILIDDGSMTLPAEKEIKNNPLKITVELYKIVKDIPNNNFGARNLALHIASVENVKWVLCTDIDHVLPSRGLEGFKELKPTLFSSYFYLPARVQKEQNGEKALSRHSDTYLISPELYWKVGGYDEDYKGYYYNGAARLFRRGLSELAKGIEVDKVYTLFYPSTIISDASPLESVKRKTLKSFVSKKKDPSVLNFEWERVL